MVETSKDILYLVISFCVLWATVFLCWMFYYAGKILKNASQVVEEFRMKIQMLSDVVNNIHGKVERLTDLVSLVKNGATGFIKNAVMRKAERFMQDSAEDIGGAAKDAVDRAVKAAGRQMKKTAKKMRK